MLGGLSARYIVIPRAYAEAEAGSIGPRALRHMLNLCALHGTAEFALCGLPIVIEPNDWAEWAARVGCTVRTLQEDLRAAKRAGMVRYTVRRTGELVFDGDAADDDDTEESGSVAA